MRLALLALALCLGCNNLYDPCFTPQSVVSDLRVLAVRTDPPEVVYDGSQIPAVQVRALIGTGGTNFSPVELNGTVCAPNPDGSCAGPRSFAGGAAGLINEIAFSLVPQPGLLDAAVASDPLRGYAGIQVQLELSALTGSSSTSAHKLLLYSPARPGYVPNHALEVDSVDLLFKGQVIANSKTAGGLALSVGKTFGLRPRVLPGPGALAAAEEYDVADLSGKTVHLREHITYSFYITPHVIFGDLESLGGNVIGTYVAGADTASEPEPGAPEPPNGLVRITPVAQTSGRLYVVARDGRGAVAFQSVLFNAPDERGCMPGCPHLEFGCQ